MSQDRNVLSNFDILNRSEKIKSKFRNLAFNKLIADNFIKEVNEFEEKLIDFYREKKIKSLFVPNDMGFFGNLSIAICKQISIPSFIFLHGLPGRYNNIDDHRSDYLIVWGEKTREYYIKMGKEYNKIFVSGHPYYKTSPISLKFSLDNILILTKPQNGAQQSNGIILADRANQILYLYSVEKVLKSLGVKSVRFRPHPSENGNWYLKYLNKIFYHLDSGNLQDSINKSTLIIGPTSTVFLESLYYEVNYVIYELSLNNIDLVNWPLVPPFDGTDAKIPVAKNEEELYYILKNKIAVDPSCFNDYISTPFDLSFVKKLI